MMNFSDPSVVFATLELYFKSYHLFLNRKIYILEPYDSKLHPQLFSEHHFNASHYNFEHNQWTYQSDFNRSKVYIHFANGSFKIVPWNSVVLDDPDKFDHELMKKHSNDSPCILYVLDYALDIYQWANHPILTHFDKFHLIKTHQSTQKSLYVFECQDWPHLLSITQNDLNLIESKYSDFNHLEMGRPMMDKKQLLELQAVGNHILFDFFDSPSRQNFERRFLVHLDNLGNINNLKENLLFHFLIWLTNNSQKLQFNIQFQHSHQILGYLSQVLIHSQKINHIYFKHKILFLYSSRLFHFLTNSSLLFCKSLLSSLNHFLPLNDIAQNNHFIFKLLDQQIITKFDAIRITQFSNIDKLSQFFYLLSTKNDLPLDFYVTTNVKYERQLIQTAKNMDAVLTFDLIKELIDPVSNFICFDRSHRKHFLIPENASFIYQYALHCVVFWKNHLSTPQPHPYVFQSDSNIRKSQIDSINANDLFTWQKTSKKRKRFQF